jgi:hypothetical protein
MKIFGIVLVIFGVIAIGGGAIFAVGSQLIPNDECTMADQYKADADRLTREADAARGTPNEPRLREQALEKTRSARLWAEGCDKRRTVTTIAMVAGLGIAAVGFLMSAVGIFMFIRGRRAAS